MKTFLKIPDKFIEYGTKEITDENGKSKTIANFIEGVRIIPVDSIKTITITKEVVAINGIGFYAEQQPELVEYLAKALSSVFDSGLIDVGNKHIIDLSPTS